MFNERRTATSSRMLAKFSSVTIAPSRLRTKVFSRKRGIYWRMPRRSVGFTLAVASLLQKVGVALTNGEDTYSVFARIQLQFFSPFQLSRILIRKFHKLTATIEMKFARYTFILNQ